MQSFLDKKSFLMIVVESVEINRITLLTIDFVIQYI